MGRKINLSGISLAKRSRSGPNSVYVDMSRGDNVQVILGAIRPFWAKWGLARVPRSASYFCVVNHATFRQLRNGRFSPNLVRNVFQCSVAESGKTVSKVFTLGVICPKNLKSKIGQNRNLTWSKLQVTGCTAERYCLLHFYSPRPGSFRDLSIFLYDVRLRSYGASKLPNFRILTYFPHTKHLKRTFR